LLTNDAPGAVAFYQKVIGWSSAAIPNDPNNYRTWVAPGGTSPMGGLMQLPDHLRQSTPPCWLIYVAVPDVDATAREAEALGGAVHKAPADIPGVGRFAVLADPQGAAFAVFKPGMPGAGSDEAGVGDFSWHELATTDWQAAAGFYGRLFGWEKSSAFDMGPMGTYYMFKRAGGTRDLGGMFTKGPDMPSPPNWLCYVRVRDVNRAVELAKRHGGKVLNGPMEVPGGDWIAQLTDPHGAAFAVHVTAADFAAAKPAGAAAPKPAKQAPARDAAKPAVSKPAASQPATKSVMPAEPGKAAAKQTAKPATGKAAAKPAAKPAAARKAVAKKAAKPARPAAKKRPAAQRKPAARVKKRK